MSTALRSREFAGAEDRATVSSRTWGRRVGANVICLMLLADASCGVSRRSVADEKVVDRFYELVAAEDYEGALGLCAPQFLEASPRPELIKDLRRTQNELGRLVSRTRSMVVWRRFFGIGSGGPTAALQFDCVYERGRTKELVGVIDVGSDAQPRIASYRIQIESENSEQ